MLYLIIEFYYFEHDSWLYNDIWEQVQMIVINSEMQTKFTPAWLMEKDVLSEDWTAAQNSVEFTLSQLQICDKGIVI